MYRAQRTTLYLHTVYVPFPQNALISKCTRLDPFYSRLREERSYKCIQLRAVNLPVASVELVQIVWGYARLVQCVSVVHKL